MCGRVYIKNTVQSLLNSFAFAHPADDVEALDNSFPRYNGAPSLEYPLIVWWPDERGPSFIRARWGLVPYWQKEATGRPPPINARAESVATNGMFKSAYRSRRALLPVDGYFEWQAIKGEKAKQPYAIAMKDGNPFCLAGIYEERKNPETGAEERSFALITCEPNPLMATIHDRMPVIIGPADYNRWISDEPDPRDLLRPYPAELMTMWPVDRKVGSPRNDTPDVIDPIELPKTDLFE